MFVSTCSQKSARSEGSASIHSIATEPERAVEQVRPSLQALAELMDEGAQVVITYPNDDAGGRAIITEISFVFGRNAARTAFTSVVSAKLASIPQRERTSTKKR